MTILSWAARRSAIGSSNITATGCPIPTVDPSPVVRYAAVMMRGVRVLNVAFFRATRPASSVAEDSSVYWRPYPSSSVLRHSVKSALNSPATCTPSGLRRTTESRRPSLAVSTTGWAGLASSAPSPTDRSITTAGPAGASATWDPPPPSPIVQPVRTSVVVRTAASAIRLLDRTRAPVRLAGVVLR